MVLHIFNDDLQGSEEHQRNTEHQMHIAGLWMCDPLLAEGPASLCLCRITNIDLSQNSHAVAISYDQRSSHHRVQASMWLGNEMFEVPTWSRFPSISITTSRPLAKVSSTSAETGSRSNSWTAFFPQISPTSNEPVTIVMIDSQFSQPAQPV